jgi:hypothetical protein
VRQAAGGKTKSAQGSNAIGLLTAIYKGVAIANLSVLQMDRLKFTKCLQYEELGLAERFNEFNKIEKLPI